MNECRVSSIHVCCMKPSTPLAQQVKWIVESGCVLCDDFQLVSAPFDKGHLAYIHYFVNDWNPDRIRPCDQKYFLPADFQYYKFPG